ncbi:four helix bundle protein [Nodularia chucula]|uniref:four helix bundle protein n=1 Tax=Nodularia chucula TaxID=3093667 RepID=UPI0039C5E54E
MSLVPFALKSRDSLATRQVASLQFKIQNSKFKISNHLSKNNEKIYYIISNLATHNIAMSQQIDITERTFNFAVRIVNLCKALDENPGVGRVLYKQLLRSGTSIGANVEESQSAQSKADFVHKLEIALKESRETKYWLKILITTNIIEEHRLLPLIAENQDIIKIIAAIIVKTKQNTSK